MSLRDAYGAPVPSRPTVKGIVADGVQLLRERLHDGRSAELTGELSDLCAAAVASDVLPEIETVSCAGTTVGIA